MKLLSLFSLYRALIPRLLQELRGESLRWRLEIRRWKTIEIFPLENQGATLDLDAKSGRDARSVFLQRSMILQYSYNIHGERIEVLCSNLPNEIRASKGL
jgi:hypothetical protein